MARMARMTMGPERMPGFPQNAPAGVTVHREAKQELAVVAPMSRMAGVSRKMIPLGPWHELPSARAPKLLQLKKRPENRLQSLLEARKDALPIPRQRTHEPI
jgi:hypothetical protein